jgi:hypothetical protein
MSVYTLQVTLERIMSAKENSRIAVLLSMDEDGVACLDSRFANTVQVEQMRRENVPYLLGIWHRNSDIRRIARFLAYKCRVSNINLRTEL